MEELRVFEGFSGYRGASFGLQKAGIKFKSVGYSEINPYAIICGDKNFPGIKNYGDIAKINPKDLPDFDLFTGGFPCQDVSIAGKRDLSAGKTILFNEIIRIAEIKKPKYMLLENVEGLLSMKSFWQHVKSELSRIGYTYRYKVLKSCDHGIPQLRPRVWILCSLDGFEPFKQLFPNKEKLNISVKDILQIGVEDKYYLTEKNINSLINGLKRRNKKLKHLLNREIANTLTTHEPKRSLHDTNLIIHSRQPRSGDPKKGGTGQLSKYDGIAYTIDTGNSQCIQIEDDFRVLTPIECFRLMGFLNDEINLEGISNSQLYKLAGNGWDVNLVSKILKQWLS